jgi:ABC-type branched-subunit amino acid transport system substrate-binding protein
LKIGVLVPFTGALSTFGPEYENAARLAAKCINNAGGVNDAAVEIVTGDTGTAAEQGVSEATRLVDVEGVVGIVGAASSAVSLAVAESVTGPNQVVQISPASTSPALSAAADNDFLFRTPISDAAQGVLLAQLIADDLGYTSVCAMYVNNAYGQGLLDSFTTAYEANGGAVTASVAHDDAQAVSYAAQLEQCTAGNPEALVAISYPVGQATVYLREAIEGSVIDQFVFVDGTRDDEMFTELGWENFDGMKGTAPGALTTDFGDAFDAAYETEFGALYQTPFVREAYDATVGIILAAASAGTNTDAVAIRDALRGVANAPGDAYGPGADDLGAAVVAAAAGTDIDYQGASGSVDFDENGDITFGAIEIWQVDAANTEIVVIARYSVDLTTGEVVELT